MAARVIPMADSITFSSPPEDYFSASSVYYESSANYPLAYSPAYPAGYSAAYPGDSYNCSSTVRPRFAGPSLDTDCFQSPSSFDWSLSTLDGSPSALDDYTFEPENPAIEAFQNTSPRELLPSNGGFASHDFAENNYAAFAHHPARYASAASWSGGRDAETPPPIKRSSARRTARRAACAAPCSYGASVSESAAVADAPARESLRYHRGRATTSAPLRAVRRAEREEEERAEGVAVFSSPRRASADLADAGCGIIVQKAGARRRPAIGISQLRALETAKQRAEAAKRAEGVKQKRGPMGGSLEQAVWDKFPDGAEAGDAAESVGQRRSGAEAQRFERARSNSMPVEVLETATQRTPDEAAGDAAGDTAGVAAVARGGCPFNTKREQQAALFGLHSTSAPPELSTRDYTGSARRASRVSGIFPPPAGALPSYYESTQPVQTSGSGARTTSSFNHGSAASVEASVAATSRGPEQSPSPASHPLRQSQSQSHTQSPPVARRQGRSSCSSEFPPSIRRAPSIQPRSNFPPLQSHAHRHRSSQSRSRSPSPSPSPVQSDRAFPLRTPPPHRHSSFDAPNKPGHLRPSHSLAASNHSETSRAEKALVRNLHVAPKAAALGFPRSGSDNDPRSPPKHPLSTRGSLVRSPYALREHPLQEEQPFLHNFTVFSHQHMRRGSLPTPVSSQSPPSSLYSNFFKPSTAIGGNNTSSSLSPVSKPPPSPSPLPSPCYSPLFKLPSDSVEAVTTSSCNYHMSRGSLRQKSRLGLRSTSVDLGDLAAGSARIGSAAHQARKSSELHQGEVDTGEVHQDRTSHSMLGKWHVPCPGNAPRMTPQTRPRPNSISVCPGAYIPLSPYDSHSHTERFGGRKGAVVEVEAGKEDGPGGAVFSASDEQKKQHQQQHQQHQHHHNQQHQPQHHQQHQPQHHQQHQPQHHQQQNKEQQQEWPRQELQQRQTQHQHPTATHESIRSRRALPSLAVSPFLRTRGLSPANSSILRTSSLATNTTSSFYHIRSNSPPLLFPPPPALTTKPSTQRPIDNASPRCSSSLSHSPRSLTPPCNVSSERLPISASSSPAHSSPAHSAAPNNHSTNTSGSPGASSPIVSSPASGASSPCPLLKSILTVRQEGSIAHTRSLGRLVRFSKVAEIHVIV